MDTAGNAPSLHPKPEDIIAEFRRLGHLELAEKMLQKSEQKWQELAARTPPEDLADPRITASLRMKMDEMRGLIKAAINDELPSQLAEYTMASTEPRDGSTLEKGGRYALFEAKIDEAFDRIFADPQGLKKDDIEVVLTGMLAQTDQQAAHAYEQERVAEWNKRLHPTDAPVAGHEHESPEMAAVPVGSTIKVVNLAGEPVDATVVGRATTGALVVEYMDAKYDNNYFVTTDEKNNIVQQKEHRTVGIDEYLRYNSVTGAVAENHESSEQQNNLIATLWPHGFEHDDFRQGATSDCYFLAAWESIKKNYPDVCQLMVETITAVPGDGNGYVVNFKGVPGRDIIITENELMRFDGSGKAVQEGAKGNRILELAYAKLVQARISGETAQHTAADAISMYDDSGQVKKGLDFEMGIALGAFKDILGASFRKKIVEGKDNMQLALKGYDNETLATAGSMQLPTKSEGREKTDVNTYTIIDAKGSPCLIAYSHAYSVREVNNEAGTITLINPYHTSEPIVLRQDVFVENFGRLHLMSTQLPEKQAGV